MNFERLPRQVIGWLYVALGVGSLTFAVLAAIPILRAINHWADGHALDWVGFAAIVSAVGGAIAQLMAQGAQWQHNRSRERLDQQARGIPPSGVPFPQPPPVPAPPAVIDQPPGGGLVNNQAIEDQQP